MTVLPLDGVRVVDLTRILAGPLATQNLADLGADVLKIERPGTGDDTRTWGPPWHGDTATYFMALNRNKRGMRLDLGLPDDRERLLDLIRDADVLVENFKPGSLDRLGLDREALHTANPRLVHCTVTSFGSTGPGAELPGYDVLIQAAGGLMHITGDSDGPPTKVGVALVDVITGLYAALGVMAGLEQLRRTGEGCHVEVALFDAVLSSLVNQASGWLMAGSSPTRQGNRHPSIAPYGVFTASDGDFVVACGSDAQWVALVEAVGRALDRPEWRTNDGRRRDLDALEPELNRLFLADEIDAWIERLTNAGVPAGRINDLPHAFAFSESLGRDMLVDGPGGYRGVASPILIDGQRLGDVRHAPTEL